MTERVLPYSVESEQAVLGCAMQEPWALTKALSMLDYEDFYRPNHQYIFRAMKRLNNDGAAVDYVTLPEELKRMERYDEVGGLEYLVTLYGSVPLATNVANYCKMVRRYSDRRQVILLCHETLDAVNQPDCDPSADLSDAWQKLRLQRAGDDDTPQPMSKLVPEHFDNAAEYQRELAQRRWKTHLPTLDNRFDTMGGPRLVIVKARRGTGKTHMVIDWAWQCAYQGRAAIIYSLEMDKRSVLHRLLARAGGVDSRTFSKYNPDENDWSCMTSASACGERLPIYVCDNVYKVSRMVQQVKALQADGVDVGLVAIDYVELIASEINKQSREQELMTTALLLRQMTKECNTTCVLLSQTNKEGSERYSEGLGNTADLLLHFERGELRYSLTAEKNRTGPNFRIECELDCRTSSISEITNDYRE